MAQVLPNHHMNTEGELQGFHFTCNRDDLAHVLPMSRRMFSMTSVYECLDGSQGQPLNGHVVRIVQDMPKYRVSACCRPCIWAFHIRSFVVKNATFHIVALPFGSRQTI